MRASLPTASELNQEAHPGGGTQVFNESAEGRVEDLFEAHLRHLDVATKSAVATKLAAISSSLDSMGIVDSALVIDGIIEKIAASEAEIRVGKHLRAISDLLHSKAAIVGDGANSKVTSLHTHIQSNLPEVVEMYRAIDRFVAEATEALSAGDFTRIVSGGRALMAVIDSASGKYVLNNTFGEGALWGYSESAGAFIGHLKMVAEEADTAANADQQPGASRARSDGANAVSPDHRKMVDAVAASVSDIYSRIMSFDAESEHIKANDPQRYAVLERAVNAIPGVSRTYEIVFLHDQFASDKRYAISPATLARYAKSVASLSAIVSQIESVDF